MVDILDYILTPASRYHEQSVPNSNGLGCGMSQNRFHHVNGDIDMFFVKCAWAWNFEWYQYRDSDRHVYFMYDCEDTAPSQDCGNPFRCSMSPTPSVPGSKWMKRDWTVGDQIVVTDASMHQWRENGQLCYSQGPAEYCMELHAAGNKNFGGDVGTQDYVEIDFIHVGMGVRERYTYAKNWGFIAWNTYDDQGNRLQAYTPNIYVHQNPSIIPNHSSVRPSAYTPVGPYLSSVGGGGSSVIPNRAYPSTWEQFTVTKVSDNIYNIRAYNGKYLCAINGGGSAIVADRDSPSIWEQFTLFRQADGYYTIRAYDAQHFVCAENGGEAALVADRTNPSTWEKFGFHLVSGNIYNIWTFNKDAFGPEFSSMPSLSTVP